MQYDYSQGVVTLLEHPGQLAELKKTPSLAQPFVKELCRFHTASSFATRRVAKVDITLRGQVRLIFHVLLSGYRFPAVTCVD